LEQVSYLSAFVTNMVSVGEESGQLGIAVRETAVFFEQETNQFIKLATSLIEPALILFIGLIIGLIVIGMLLPIFEIHVMAK
jgi:type IV pilus assembly protein PilC